MKTLTSFVALLAALGAAGCSTPTQTNLAKLTVQYAVIKVCDRNPEYAPRVVEIATQIEALAGGETANTVDLLLSLVRAKIDFSKLDAADKLLVNALIDQVGIELKVRLGTTTFDAGKLLLVSEVAGWIREAAAMAAAAPARAPQLAAPAG